VSDDELERIRKKSVVAYFKVPLRHSPGETEENHENHSVRISGLWVEILIRHPGIRGRSVNQPTTTFGSCSYETET